jgi:hypothetical protein
MLTYNATELLILLPKAKTVEKRYMFSSVFTMIFRNLFSMSGGDALDMLLWVTLKNADVQLCQIDIP